MQPRLSTFTLSIAMAFGAAAIAADLPKEGNYSGTYSGFGTVKLMPIGKERVLSVIDESGPSISNGPGQSHFRIAPIVP
jgi:hypothetical protein